MRLPPVLPPNVKIELHLGDCVTGMSRLPDCSIDVVPTSPGFKTFIGFEIDAEYMLITWERLGPVTGATEIVETHSSETTRVSRGGEAN